MTKHEFLAISLQHGIYCEIIDFKINYVGNNIEKIVCINQWSKDGRLWSYETTGGAKPSIEGIKPILRPLSDLTKEIEHKGENFVPINILKEMNDGDYIYISEFGVSIDNGYAAGYNLNIAFTFIQKLIEWHFDIAGLIEKGEAIDVNTLSENPYK